MEKFKIEEIKDEVLFAVKNHLFNTLEFENKVQEWFYGDEDRFQEEETKTFNLHILTPKYLNTQIPHLS